MDGIQKSTINSLQFRLSLGVTCAILIIAFSSAIFSYWWAFNEALELQDDQLSQIAALANNQHLMLSNSETNVENTGSDPDSHFVVQLLTDKSAMQTELHQELDNLPHDITEGLQTRSLSGVSWRILVKTVRNNSKTNDLPQDTQRILVAQQTEVRDEVARDSAFNALIPLILLIPLLLIFVNYLFSTVFKPVKKLIASLDARSANNLEPILAENLMNEISPFVMAINRLLFRVNKTLAIQHRFVRDAAHELRTPLTAISLQVQRILELELTTELKNRLDQLSQSTERSRLLMEQMLTLARLQEKVPPKLEYLSLKTLLRDLLEDLMPLIEQKEMTVSVVGKDQEVTTNYADIRTLIKNVLDNAIRYTPTKGAITIQIIRQKDHTLLEICDTGPGISAEELERVFDPFYRILGTNESGSGLGLAIVKTIADQLSLTVGLSEATNSTTGLKVVIKFQ